MIRAILKKGKIQPLDELPQHWREGQELIVEGCELSDEPAEIRNWHDKLVALTAEIPAEDHERMMAAVAEQDRQAKERMRRDMNTMSVRLPNSLHQQLREYAEREGTSINQLISSAVAEKLAALMTMEYLEARGQRGSRQKFEAALQTVPDLEPEDFDRLPSKAPVKRPRSGGRGKK